MKNIEQMKFECTLIQSLEFFLEAQEIETAKMTAEEMYEVVYSSQESLVAFSLFLVDTISDFVHESHAKNTNSNNRNLNKSKRNKSS